MNFRIVFISFVVLGFTASTCRHATEPLPPPGTDTTSHRYIWISEVVGVGNSSVFNDVAIINDSLAYAVGEVYLKDTSGILDPEPYNLAKWDGKGWQLFKIQFYGYCGQPKTLSTPINGIHAFSDSVIWLSHFNQVVTWNGKSQTNIVCSPVDIYRMWGSSPRSVYSVGAQGQIGFYDGTKWIKLAGGGTPLSYQDVWGDVQGQSVEIIAVASDKARSLDRLITRIVGNSVQTISDSGMTEPIYGVWFATDKSYYLVGSGIFRKEHLADAAWVGGVGTVTNIFTEHIRGNGINDLMAVGDFGDVNHFNGSTWHNFSELQQPDRVLYRVAVKGKRVVAVGIQGNRALVIRGEHIP